jgi:hypothetical protein
MYRVWTLRVGGGDSLRPFVIDRMIRNIISPTYLERVHSIYSYDMVKVESSLVQSGDHLFATRKIIYILLSRTSGRIHLRLTTQEKKQRAQCLRKVHRTLSTIFSKD